MKNHVPIDAKHCVMHEEQARRWWEKFRHFGPNGHNDEEYNDSNTQAALKIGSNNFDVLIILEVSERLSKEHQVTTEAHGGVGHGISRVFIEGLPENIVAYIKALRSEVERRHGYVVCTHLPFKLRKLVCVWGEIPPYFALLEGIKRTNDPNRILNRQRFVGGI